MKVVTITFTEVEINQLAKLMDSAVRTEGLPAANVAVPLLNKLVTALDQAPNVEPSTSVQ